MKSFLLLLLAGSGFGLAQTTFQEQAARLQNINSYLLDFRPASAPIIFDKNTLELSFDLNPQPTINAKVGIKDEPLDPPSVVPKLRGRYVWSSGIFAGAAFAPGITFQDYKADFVSVELGYRFHFAGLDAALRGSYSDGEVEGPITEPEAKDVFKYTNQAFDFTLGKTYNAWHFYGFAGGISNDTDLTIEVDGVYLENDDSTYYGGLGVTYDWRSFGITLEQNATDDYLANLIFSVGYRF